MSSINDKIGELQLAICSEINRTHIDSYREGYTAREKELEQAFRKLYGPEHSWKAILITAQEIKEKNYGEY